MIVAALLYGLSAASAAAQAPPAAPCSTPEYRQLDFWVGDWTLEFDLPGGGVGRAVNRITADEFGSCAIVEHFRYPGGAANGGDFIGSSYSIYDPGTRSWRQMWVDSQGGVFDLRGGPVAGQRHVFELVTTEPRGPQGKTMRMIWEEVTSGSLVWRWQERVESGWADRWVIRYRRNGASPS